MGWFGVGGTQRLTTIPAYPGHSMTTPCTSNDQSVIHTLDPLQDPASHPTSDGLESPIPRTPRGVPGPGGFGDGDDPPPTLFWVPGILAQNPDPEHP